MIKEHHALVKDSTGFPLQALAILAAGAPMT